MLPAAASLKKQGANNGATMAFLISTPESGVDSIAISYALLDPVMTIARPVVAFVTAAVAGITENVFNNEKGSSQVVPDLTCPVDGCCDGEECPPDRHSAHHTLGEKLKAGIGYALRELWSDIAGWFFIGLLLAGVITTLIPSDFLMQHLGGGISSMLIMLVIGIPIYICATASTPVAASLILSGISPGAALVFLLTGPATNVTSLTVLLKVIGKRATVIYLVALAVSAVLFGLILDGLYSVMGLSAKAMAGQAAEIIPYWIKLAGAFLLLGLSVKPIYHLLKSRIFRISTHGKGSACDCEYEHALPTVAASENSCGCDGST